MGAQIMGISLPEYSNHPTLWQELDLAVDDVRADIRETEWVARAKDFDPEIVFHLAAQPLVSEGYRRPAYTFDVNVNGTANLMAHLAQWPSLRACLVITTDKVYDPRQSGPFVESDFLGGADPYSASKAACELVVTAWPKGDLRVATARAGNVIGGGDWAANRLIPDAVRAWHDKEQLVLRMPDAVRPWQHVLDPLCGYIAYAERLAATHDFPSSLNFGPSPANFHSVQEVIEVAANICGVPSPAWRHLEAQPFPETKVLRLDSQAAEKFIGWRGIVEWQVALEMTMNWYARRAEGQHALDLVSDDIAEFQRISESQGLADMGS